MLENLSFYVLFKDDINCYIHIVLMTDVGMRAKRCWQDTDISDGVLGVNLSQLLCVHHKFGIDLSG